MKTIKIVGIDVPVFLQKDNDLIFPSDLVLTDSTEKNLKNILYPLVDGKHLILVGDAGVGKNALVYYINFLRKHSTSRYSFNEDTLPEDLIGSYRFVSGGKGFEWIDGTLTEAMRNGKTFVADELNLTPSHTLKRFSSVFENSYLELLEGSGEKIFHKNGFNIIGTQNPSEGFEGRKPLPYSISRNFSVVYIDPHTPDELLFILSKLYSTLDRELLKKLIRISLETENRILKNQLGKGDLERYHFNIRNLKRICNRIVGLNIQASNFLIQEISNIYAEPFRKEEDKNLQLDLIQNELGFSEKSIKSSVQLKVEKDKFFINNKKLDIQNSELIKSNLLKIPITEKIGFFLEKIVSAVQFSENILIEYREVDDPYFLLDLIAGLNGYESEKIHLSKGTSTSDLLGGLKPITQNEVSWVDGPLVRALKSNQNIILSNLETASAELIEKLNMLTDDARAISLPRESGNNEPIPLKNNSFIVALKSFRNSKSSPTISRAFRNRFTSILFPDLEDYNTLFEISDFYLGSEVLSQILTKYHLKIKELSVKRNIGSSNIHPYIFGLSNFINLLKHITIHNTEKNLQETIKIGAKIYYSNQISNANERLQVEDLLALFLDGIELNEKDIFQEIEKKKTFTDPTEIFKKKWWDETLHKRSPNTGKAELKNSGKILRNGVEINTPETGGRLKEGPDAWFGAETRGNQGQGEPAGGGGGWGYRTEELYQEFLKKRKILWDYRIHIDLKEFKEVFGKNLEEVEFNLEHLFDPELNITRQFYSKGNRIDVRKYISYMNRKGSNRIFDKTQIDKKEEKLKGVEVVFLVNKSRRIFNFEYGLATLSTLLVSSYLLEMHQIQFSIYTYSDIKNSKKEIQIKNIKKMEDEYNDRMEETMFQELCLDWQGDSVEDQLLFQQIEHSFSKDAETKILVMVSDFRGKRGKIEIENEITSEENIILKEKVREYESKNIEILGVGLGRRYIAEHIFKNWLQITAENFYNMPNLIGREISRLILLKHESRLKV